MKLGSIPRKLEGCFKKNEIVWSHLRAVCLEMRCIYSVYVLTRLRPTLCDPIDCSPPGSPVHGILQARVLEHVAISLCRRSFWPRDGTWSLASPALAGGLFTRAPTGKPQGGYFPSYPIFHHLSPSSEKEPHVWKDGRGEHFSCINSGKGEKMEITPMSFNRKVECKEEAVEWWI